MLDPDDSCLACHRLPTMLSRDFVTMLSAAAAAATAAADTEELLDPGPPHLFTP